MYADAQDPWQLSSRWYEQRKYAITVALLPRSRYRHAFEPGCSIGALTTLLAARCERITAVDVAEAAVTGADARLREHGCRDRVSLSRGSLDERWPAGPFDLVVLSEVAYYLNADTLATVLRRECPRLAPGATVIAAHWRHPVADYPLTGDAAHAVIAATPGLEPLGCYRDDDVVIEVFDTGDARSVAAREEVPGARA
ncbi:MULTISPECIES: SAM-dependent methyltransferase [Mycobacterium]|uniref:Methyltransferase n=1 Tax=Mycobacterium kiyosense TaxID=2871094 RepID=A0A9P3QAM1_9MYCO|nr:MULTISPECIES: SAM-dependent methyltransferase [Mycobacterium]BDB45453.1 methyltransferase [Mycobacterium kiyosense]BDE16910.1 methyltransferase [Mycobacterium sp. 20KCMC460]GLB84435.1 methyltransferase [Mycobacterium kiyosense]GLB96942.1 methyltransferase [Mycobacterium kiyosense]GLC03461.1 methyltransferase [Mycobacterium kiyosense]